MSRFEISTEYKIDGWKNLANMRVIIDAKNIPDALCKTHACLTGQGVNHWWLRDIDPRTDLHIWYPYLLVYTLMQFIRGLCK